MAIITGWSLGDFFFLGMELRVFCMLDKFSTTELHPPALSGDFWDLP